MDVMTLALALRSKLMLTDIRILYDIYTTDV